jgi:hypothetical protein
MSDLSFLVLLNLEGLTTLINWAILIVHALLHLLIATEVAMGMAETSEKVSLQACDEEAKLPPCDWSWGLHAPELPSNLLGRGITIPLPGKHCVVHEDDDPWEGFVPSREISYDENPWDENPWAADAQEITLERLVGANFSAFKRQLEASPLRLFLTRNEWRGCGRRTLFIEGQSGYLEYTPFKAIIQEENELLWKVFSVLDEADPMLRYFDLDTVEVPCPTLAEEVSAMIQAKIPFPDYGDFDFGEVGLPEIEAV